MSRRRKTPITIDDTDMIVNIIPKSSKIPSNNKGSETLHPSKIVTWGNAVLYVLSGCSQPLIMTLCKNAGLADPGCQLYMLFYALGPTTLIFPLWFGYGNKDDKNWPSIRTMGKAAAICLFDIFCTAMNYTGASLAGPTIFAIVYSSVTIWTALFSQLFLNRPMRCGQWISIVTVFAGLALTATDSLKLGDDVHIGLILILIGSAMHATTYIMSEGIMTVTSETLTARQNNAIQSLVASMALSFWQIIFTLPRWEERIRKPTQRAGTTYLEALTILGLLALSNLIHSSTFFHTLKYFPGGSTSAGVMKALQAVLVFVVTHLVYCGRIGGPEMCFTKKKMMALITVSGGVVGYGVATRYYQNCVTKESRNNIDRIAGKSHNFFRNQKSEHTPLLLKNEEP